MSDAKQPEAPRIADLLLVAQAFGLLAWGALLWIALRTGAVEIPMLGRWNPPPSTLPGLLWLVAAWRLRGVRDWTPAWNGTTRRLLIAAGLHLYLIPYLGWWQSAAPDLYQRFNTLLLAVAIAFGVTGAYRLAYETARRLGDRLLRAEVWLSILATPALAGGFALLLRWSANRAGAGDAGIVEWFLLLRELPGGPRIALLGVLMLPLMPFPLLMLEARARALAAIPDEAPPQNQA